MRRLSSSSSTEGFRLLAKLAFLAAAASLSAQQIPESATSLSREVKDVFGRCAKAVVKIEASDQHGELSGTGFFVDPTGTLYTAYSVGGEAENVTVEFKGKKYPARQLMADLRSDFVRLGEPRHGWIGANVAEASAEVEGSRAVTKDIMKDTPAAESGMKSGDVVLQIGRTKVHEPEDILDASFFLTAGDVVPITVMRGNEKMTFNVLADFHPASQPRAPLLAAPPLSNRAIPLNLQSAPERSP